MLISHLTRLLNANLYVIFNRKVLLSGSKTWILQPLAYSLPHASVETVEVCKDSQGMVETLGESKTILERLRRSSRHFEIRRLVSCEKHRY